MKIRKLKVTILSSVTPAQLYAFRKAVQEWVGDTGQGVLTQIGQEQYPLAQYRSEQGSGQIILLNEAADIFADCLASRQHAIKMAGTTTSNFRIEKLEMAEIPATTEKLSNFKYKICNWVPLSQSNYKLFKNMQQQEELLTNLMVRHIANYCHAVGYPISDDEIRVDIINKMSSKPATIGSAKLMSFSGEFKTNINLPKGIGLGRFASLGWGIVK